MSESLPNTPTILTAAEAANVLRCTASDPAMLDLLPLIDDYIKDATGRDWAQDIPVHDKAKNAARILLVRWYEDPGAMAAGDGALSLGFGAVITQLKVKAMELASEGVPVQALALVATNITGEMAPGASLVLVFNHELTDGAIAQVSLKTSAGVAVATTNSLDVTGKILTVAPNASLSAGSSYSLVVDHAADVYGQTLESTINFVTA